VSQSVRADDLLKSVSRSFYLSIRILPRPVRPQLGLAYLLARAADTIADTRLVAVQCRRQALARLSDAIGKAAAGGDARVPGLGELAEAQEGPVGRGTGAERQLLERVPALLQALREFEPEDRTRIRGVLEIIATGQDRDLARFGAVAAGEVAALQTRDELEEYTYQVAGCVGEFWTRMCVSRLCWGNAVDVHGLLREAVEYGRGLQLVNILRDLAGDLRLGRCYLPLEDLARCGVTPADLLDPATLARIRGLLEALITRASDGLAAGWRYARSIPRRHARVRLASCWPALIGIRTVALLRAGNVLDPGHRLRIGRSEVQALLMRSVLSYPFEGAWSRLFDRARKASG